MSHTSSPSAPLGLHPRWRSVGATLLILTIWAAAAWRTWSRTMAVKDRPEILRYLKVYDSLRDDLEGIPELWLLIEKPTQPRFRKLPRGQAQYAQYALTPTVVHKARSPEVAALKVRATRDRTVILHFYMTDVHRLRIEELLRRTAASRSLEMTTRRAGSHVVLYRFDKGGRSKS